MTKRTVGYLLTVFIMLAMVTAACAAPKTTAPTPTPAPSPGAERPAGPKPQMTREQQLVEAAKAKGETEVVVWAMSWYHGQVEKAFEAKYPFLKVKVWDPPGDDLETRLIAEYKAGRYTPDVLTQPYERISREHKAGILQEYEWPNVQGWPHQPPHKFWVVDQLSTRLPMYNTQLVTPADVPKKWEDLNNSKWKGKALLSTSAASWFIGFAYEQGNVSTQGVNWEPSIKLWKDIIKATSPRIMGGFQGPLELLVAGDAHIMLMAAGTTGLFNIRRGAPIDFAPFPKTFGDPWVLAMPKNPPHPNAAKLFLDWMTSEEGSFIYANLFPNPSLNPLIAKKDWASQFYRTRGVEIFTLPPELATEANFMAAGDTWRKDIVGR